MFLKGKTVSSVEIFIYRNQKGEFVGLLAYGMLLQKGESYKDVAGLINIDSGGVIPILNDVPKDKMAQGDQTFFGIL